MAHGSAADWDQCFAWSVEAERKLADMHNLLLASDASTEDCKRMNELVRDAAALIDGVFGTAMKAREHFQREAEKLHEAREAWEDEHAGHE